MEFTITLQSVLFGPVADELDQPRVVGGEPVHLLAAIAAQQRHGDATICPREHLPDGAGILPACEVRQPDRCPCFYDLHRMSTRARITLARVYADPESDGGERVLVESAVARGFRKGDPRVGHWLPKVAPSADLRHWYSHQPRAVENEFAARYTAELDEGEAAAALAELRAVVDKGPVTLVTATRDLDGSHAAVLAKLLS